MRRRPIMKFDPALEPLESKQLLSAGPLTTHTAAMTAERTGLGRQDGRHRENTCLMRSSGSALLTRPRPLIT